MTLANLLLLAPLFGAGPAADLGALEETLAALRDGAPPPAVSPEVAREAVERIVPGLTGDEELGPLARVARAGAPEAAATRLAAVLERGAAGVAAAARELAACEPALRDAALAPVLARSPALLRETLTRVAFAADEDAAAAAGAARLLAPLLEPRAVAAALEVWAAEPEGSACVLAALEEVARAPTRARELVRALALELDALPGAEAALGAAFAALLADPEAAAEALELVAAETYGPEGALLRGLPGLPPDHWPEASAALERLLEAVDERGEGLEPALLVSALLGAADLRLPAVHGLALALSQPEGRAPDSVRAAAAEALGRVGYRDAPTLAHLIALLGDRAAPVRRAAHEALLRKAGRRDMPARAPIWRAWWRRLVDEGLPDEPPIPLEQRMAQEREALAERWRFRHAQLAADRRP